jgi:hypothetical protein
MACSTRMEAKLYVAGTSAPDPSRFAISRVAPWRSLLLRAPILLPVPEYPCLPVAQRGVTLRTNLPRYCESREGRGGADRYDPIT